MDANETGTGIEFDPEKLLVRPVPTSVLTVPYILEVNGRSGLRQLWDLMTYKDSTFRVTDSLGIKTILVVGLSGRRALRYVMPHKTLSDPFLMQTKDIREAFTALMGHLWVHEKVSE